MLYQSVVVSIVVLAAGYFLYGGFLSRWLGLDANRKTPACEINDGMDYVPAKPSLLVGQHVSAISAAGPIVGPILAGIWFGWLPALLWILLGSIFIGGVHDYASLVASVRHRATSIGELVKEYMSPTSHALFLSFVWLALIYVIIAFTDITAQTFKAVSSEGTATGPGVAVTSFLYLAIGMAMGVALYKFKMNLWAATALFLSVVLFVIWLGARLPAPIVDVVSSVSVKQWDIVILVYCFVASLIPMWLLLQPRGYLGGWLLYLTIIVSLAGALFGGFKINYPALNVEGLKSLSNGSFMFPLLFITVACGACSGFHAIVSSGTTSKQLMRETDAKPVGYGSMLIEALVAVLALATVMMLAKGSATLGSHPNVIYANGIAGYLGLLGMDRGLALSFALLAFATFVYDTLDVCSRLARYILQELFGWKSKAGAYAATFLTLFVPFLVLMLSKEKGYMVAWPIFGTSNQLLASLTLLAISVWLIKTGRNAIYALLPMAFMLVMTLWSLVLLTLPFVEALPGMLGGASVKTDTVITGVFGVVLLVLSVWLVIEALNTLVFRRGAEAAAGE